MTRSTIIVATFATSAYELFNTDPIALFFGWWENR
jgi:hypothetical protein